ncbi:hypothetical protein CKO25_00560 [Thiocapsa imhoffii]|uniref:Fibronectin type-III domain-containing protein n=1 Tax=Thiocapsa imhoffii TaxID=382777 RepID=A0A9X0WEE0_9GAMM|nr:FG-GAP-like repeat-containing protein [Thiocapsa imhoffii]MBK1643169.1 hypothetical protein [Thiocapsa imhoffii]
MIHLVVRWLSVSLLFGWFLSVGLLQAQTGDLGYTLRWAEVDDPRVAGYRVYYGVEPGHYLEMIDVGLETTHRVTGLEPDTVYYFTVSAYDAEGFESSYTPEVTSGAFRYLFGMGGPFPSDGGWVEVANASLLQEQRIKAAAPEYGGGSGEVRVATGDLNGNGRDEVVLGFGPAPFGQSGGWFRLLDSNLAHLAWGRVDWDDYNATNGETYPAVGDLDGDGKAEIVIGLGSGGGGMMQVFGYDAGGLVPLGWTALDWPEYNALSGATRPALGDVDGNGRADLLVGLAAVEDRARPAGGDPAAFSETGSTPIPGGFFFLKRGIDLAGSEDETMRDALANRLLLEREITTGSVSWGEYARQLGETWPALGDLSGDGRYEIVVGLGRGGEGLFEVFQYDAEAIVSLGLGALNWPEYLARNGEMRPTVHSRRGAPGQILFGLGAGGEGRVEVFELRYGDWENVDSFELWPRQYRMAEGATWPAVKLESR